MEEKGITRPRNGGVRFVDRQADLRSAAARSLALGLMAAVPLSLLIWTTPLFAQTGAEYPRTLPDTSIAPASGGASDSSGEMSAPAPGGGGTTSTVEVPDDSDNGGDEAPPPASKPQPVHHHTVHRKSISPASVPHNNRAVASAEVYKSKPVPPPPVDVEAEHGTARLQEDSWAYSRPSKAGKRLEQVHSGKFLTVTGITNSYVRVQLKNGSTAYVPASAIELTRPTDKIFQLTSDAAVLSQPTRYGKKISEVHKGHDVHVVGLALNYMKIRMRDGVEGFIPVHALE
jgi:hypothetical protein